MTLNQIRILSKDQLIMVIRESGFGNIAEVLKDRDITGETFLELSMYHLIQWKLPATTRNILSRFIEQVKDDPSILIKNTRLEITSTSTNVTLLSDVKDQRFLELNNFKNKLAIVLNSKKPSDVQKSLMSDSDILNLNPKPILLTPTARENTKLPTIDNNSFTESTIPKKPISLPRTTDLKDISVSNNNRKPIPIPKKEVQSTHLSHTNTAMPIEEKQQTVSPKDFSYVQLSLNKELSKPYNSNNAFIHTEDIVMEEGYLSNENKYTKKTEQKLTGGIFDFISKKIMRYENHDIHSIHSNPSTQDALEKYKNRPLPPIPRDDEEIKTETNCFKFKKTDQRIMKSFDDNLTNRNAMDGLPTHRSVDYNNERFFRNTDRKGAERLLKHLIDGAFLFRPSKKHYLALTIKYQNEFYNFGIERTSNMRIRLTADLNNIAPEFRTLREFSEYFTNEPICFKNDSSLVEIILRPVLPNNII